MIFELNDERLNTQVGFYYSDMSLNPNASFPDSFSSSSDQVGFYKFIENPRVDYTDLVSSIEEDAI